jgi:hypothetical protein
MEAYCAERIFQDKPEDHHWNWRWKANYWRPLLGYHSFAIVCEKSLQGLMLASDFRSARLQDRFGKSIVYVEFVATAPWNRPEVQKPPKYRGVGTAMVAAAIELSCDLKYRGRIGLHSLPAAVQFYRDKCGLTELGSDAEHEDLVYFEMTENQAKRFRQERRKA